MVTIFERRKYNIIKKIISYIRNIFNKSNIHTITLTPKGISFFKYLKEKEINEDIKPIEAYDKFFDEFDAYMTENCLKLEKEFLKNNSNKILNIKIINSNKWYRDYVNKTFDVYDYNKNNYSLIGKCFGYLIKKEDCIVL